MNEYAALVAATLVTGAPVIVGLRAEPLKIKQGTFKVIGLPVAGSTDEYVICDSNGKIKSFKEVDTAVKLAVKELPAMTHANVNFDTTELQPQSVTVKTIAQKQATADADVLRQQGVANKVAVAFAARASWATGTLAERAAYAELTLEKAASERYLAFLQSERAALV
jgi:hypothetical protein